MIDINKLYYQKNINAYLLTPLAAIYWGINKIRKWCYQLKIFKSKKFSIPVVIVGNITLGGTGKTPLIIYLTELLQANGFKPGVVSRGYGATAPFYPFAVTQESKANQVGDEPLMIYMRTACPVVVDPKRVNAVEYLLDNNDVDIVLSDDGMQHYALQRDIEIAVLDGERRLGNGLIFPAGPLRESSKKLKHVDFVIVNGNAGDAENSMHLIPDKFINLKTNTPIELPDLARNKTIHAVAGIGNPQRFFNSLKQLGFNIVEHPFSDHHAYIAEDFNFCKNNDVVIMTEKDAVKCRNFSCDNFYYLPVSAELDDEFAKQFIKRVKSLFL